MFCYQCEQTAGGVGCQMFGICGKEPDVAALQDLLVHITKDIAWYTHRARKLNAQDAEIDAFILRALFTTVTNVNFDPVRMHGVLLQASSAREKAKALYEKACDSSGTKVEGLKDTLNIDSNSVDELVRLGVTVSIPARGRELGADITGLQELLLYGLKGAAAYLEHARVLGCEDSGIYTDLIEGIEYLTHDNPTVDGLLGMCLKAGEINYRAMELLDRANTDKFGHPEPTTVRVEPVKGKAILVSGHDLKDLEVLLKQTEGKGINVYTHGEMLPALAYPRLKAYKHLVGNYGGAWMNQDREFDAFPGAILMTTNCIQQPLPSYMDRIFTSGVVAWPEVKHIEDGNFTPVIEAALAQPGFTEDGPDKTITIGFGRNAVMSVADKVIEAVKSGDIRHFFLVGGCDGAKPGRSYYTEFAQSVPQDCVVLTLACGKYRFNKLDFGDIGGIPRLLDIGQCNDAYSAIQIAVALADAFDCGVNDLPLSLIISWYEQKAVAILLTLLYLGVRNIKLGPSLPAFLTPAAVQVLVDKFALAPVTTPEEDLKALLA